jgi:hypothetical protein
LLTTQHTCKKLIANCFLIANILWCHCHSPSGFHQDRFIWHQYNCNYTYNYNQPSFTESENPSTVQLKKCLLLLGFLLWIPVCLWVAHNHFASVEHSIICTAVLLLVTHTDLDTLIVSMTVHSS